MASSTLGVSSIASAFASSLGGSGYFAGSGYASSFGGSGYFAGSGYAGGYCCYYIAYISYLISISHDGFQFSPVLVFLAALYPNPVV